MLAAVMLVLGAVALYVILGDGGQVDVTRSLHGPILVLVTHDSTVAARAQRLGLMKNGTLTVTHPVARPPV